MGNNRFGEFSPEEREILRLLLQEHANTVSQIAIASECRVSEYLIRVEALENECKQA